MSFLKFNRNLFAILKLQRRHVHSMLQIYNDNSETIVGRHIKVQIGLGSWSEKDEK